MRRRCNLLVHSQGQGSFSSIGLIHLMQQLEMLPSIYARCNDSKRPAVFVSICSIYCYISASGLVSQLNEILCCQSILHLRNNKVSILWRLVDCRSSCLHLFELVTWRHRFRASPSAADNPSRLLLRQAQQKFDLMQFGGIKAYTTASLRQILLW